MLTRDALLGALARDVASFAEILATHDLSAPVPDCPGWTLTDLGGHLGSVHGWARDAVETGAPHDEPSPPADPVLLAGWYAEQAAALLDTLVTTPAGTECWTFGPRPRTVDFWVRRQPHETSVHLRDARRAIGLDVAIEPRLAADGVDEVVTMFFPRQVRLQRIPPLVGGVRLVATDGDEGPWVLAGDGLTANPTYAATLTGTAEALLLWLWHRDGGTVQVDGDSTAVAAARAATLTP
jgi:uncharacterized protein (TIGR03083 family)